MSLPAYFPQNMAILKRLYPGLVEELDKAPEEDELLPEDFKVEAAQGGGTLAVRGLYVHSPRDPVREARRLAEAALSETAGKTECPVVILGFGLGYAAEAAAEIDPDRPIIIVEKRREIVRKALELRDLGNFLSKNRIVFVLGKDGSGITGALALFEKQDRDMAPAFIRNRTLISLDEGWYAAVEGRIKTWLSRNDVNRATLKRFGRRWVRNLSHNLRAIRDLPGIQALEGILKAHDGETGIPVFLAAAGPTLERSGPFVSEIARRCVVIAVDTSLRFLLAKGVDPDFVVSVDPQYWNFRHLDRTRAPGTYLIAESAVYPPCLRHPFRGCFLCGSLFPLGRFIEDRVDPKGDLGSGGSVATGAWDFARRLGASTVWIAGLDLSFPELKTHFKGALFEDRSHAESSRFATGETWSFRALMGGQPFYVQNSLGGRVLTDKRLSLYAAWFESRFRQYSGIKNLSLSGEGMAIKGLEPGSPEALLELPERREEINSLLEKAYSAIQEKFFSPESAKSRSEAYETALKTLLEGLENIRSTADEARISADTGCRRYPKSEPQKAEQEKILRTLDRANKAIARSAVKEVAGFLFPEADELEGPPLEDPFLKHLEFSGNFYRALREAAEYNIKALLGGKTF
jgi:hypothetical protein